MSKIISPNGSLIVGSGTLMTGLDDTLNGSELFVAGIGTAVGVNFLGDPGINFFNPSIDAPSLIASMLPGQTSPGTTVLNAAGDFVNEGTILANGPAGSTFTINIQPNGSGTPSPGYFFNPGLIVANPGNKLTINVAANAALFNTGSIIANGGSLMVNFAPGGVAGGDAATRGFYLIEAGGTLETQSVFPTSDGANGSHPDYEFADSTPGNTLKIDNIGGFGGAIIHFSQGDTIDLGMSLAVGTLAFTSSTSILDLQAADGTGLASLLIGNAGSGITSGTFPVINGSADGFNLGLGVDGNTVLTTTRALIKTTNNSGTWQSAASWIGGVVPSTVASPDVGLGAVAPFTLTTGGIPVSVGGISIDSPFVALQITSNTTLTTGQISIFAGSVDIAGGNTLTGGAIQLLAPQTSFTLEAGATADLAGRLNINVAPTAGVLPLQLGENPYAFTVADGTAVIKGALIAGPTGTTRGGGVSIGYDSSGQSAQLSVNAGATVTATHTTIGSDPTSSGTLIVNGVGASYTDMIDAADTFASRGNMTIGYNDLGSNIATGLIQPSAIATAVVMVENGATLTEQGSGASIGYSVNSAGAVTIETGGLWNLASNGVSGGLGVGRQGSGTLDVLSGGSVAIGAPLALISNGTSVTSGGLGVGQVAGGAGTIVVSGAGSQLSTLNGFIIGGGGQGVLDILNGGTVVVRAAGVSVGATVGASSTGTIVVGGSGAAAALNFAAASGTVAAAGGLTVGLASRGTLVVADSGTIGMSGTGGLAVGGNAGSFGTVSVGGTATAALISLATAGVTVGNSGTGVLSVTSLGTINLNGSSGLAVGSAVGASGTVIVGGTAGNAAINLSTASVQVGGSGSGVLTLNNLGTLNLGGAGGLTVAANAGSTGTVTVNGGILTEGTASSGATVGSGSGAQGALVIQNAGTASFNGGGVTLGNAPASNGSLLVSGPGSVLKTGTAAVTVGNSGNATATLTNGGVLSDGSFLSIGVATGSNGTVAVSSATLTATAINVGLTGNGRLTATNGTIAATGVLGVGINSGGSGTVILSGAKLTASGGIEIGEAGSGTLSAQGGSITTSNLALGGSGTAPLGSSSNRATMTGGADIAVSGVLAVWAGSTLSLDATSGVDVGASGNFVGGAINLESGHTLIGGGSIAAAVINNGLILASGSAAPNSFVRGTLEIQGAISGTGSLAIGANGVLQLDSAVPTGQAIQFGASSELILNTPGTALANAITGLSVGDRIDLNLGAGTTISNVISSGSTVTVVTNTGSYALTNVSFAAGTSPSFFWGTDFLNGDASIQVAPASLSWTGAAADAAFATAGNWAPNQVPNSSLSLAFTNNPGPITGAGSGLYLGFGNYGVQSFQTWTLNNANLTVAGDPNAPFLPNALGFQANVLINGGVLNAVGGTGNIGNIGGVTVTAQGGAQVTTLGDSVGTNSGQAGSLVLTGVGTGWTEISAGSINGNGTGFLTIGGSGPGNGQGGSAGFLTVSNSASLTTGGSASLGGFAIGSFGSATITAGGSWKVGSGLSVGASGTGILGISGGTVTAGGFASIAQNAGSQGTITVNAGGSFAGNSGLTIGQGGSGTLIVSGASVSDTGSMVLGQSITGFGNVGLTSGTITTAGGLQVGASGTGLMTIGNGGTLLFGGSFNTVGGNANGVGSLLISAGGTAAATLAPASTTVLQIGAAGAAGSLGAASGTVVVSGVGALLNLNGNGLSVGNSGIGGLTVAQGGSVNASVLNTGANSSLAVANVAGGQGAITVTGTGSVLNLGGSATMGQGGSATMTISAGGLVNITNTATGTTNLTLGAGFSTPTNNGGQADVTVSNFGTLADQGGISLGGNGASGVLNVNSGGLVKIGTSLNIGSATQANGTIYGGTGALNIGAGGTVLITQASQTTITSVVIGTDNSVLGLATGADSGAVTVSGAGARLDTNGNGLEVGRNSIGSLSILQGGSVALGTPNSSLLAALMVGRFSTGNVLLSDSGSMLTTAGFVGIGRAGTGNLLIQNHASLMITNDATGISSIAIGAGQGTVNTAVTLTQAGGSGSAEVTTGGYLYAQGGVQVGRFGTAGILSIVNGGTVEAGTQIILGLSDTLAAGGSLITPTGTTIVSSASLMAGSGVVTVGAGGALLADGSGITAPGTADIIIGNGAGVSTALNVNGIGATVNSGGYQIAVGAAGSGALLIASGGTVLAGTPFANDEAIYAGLAPGSTGAITVTDLGSKLVATGQLSIGLGASGSLLVQNQGTVISGNNVFDPFQGFEVGQSAGANGSATVTGTRSLLSNTGRFVVGDAGFGRLSILAGGTVVTSSGAAAQVVPTIIPTNTIVPTNTPIIPTNTPFVPTFNPDTATGAIIGAQAGAAGSSVNVSGIGSDWQVGGALLVGDGAHGVLSVTAGGTVSVGSLDTGVFSGSGGAILLSGTGSSLLSTGQIVIGDSASVDASITGGATLSGSSMTLGAHLGSSGNLDIEGFGSRLLLSGQILVGGSGTAELTIGAGATASAAAGFVIGNGGIVNQTGGAFIAPASGINTGRIGGTGLLQGAVQNSGTIYAQGGTYEIAGPVTTGPGGPGSLQIIGSGADLVLDASVDNGQTVAFSGVGGTLTINNLNGITPASITGFTAGDIIVLNGVTLASQSFNSTTDQLFLTDTLGHHDTLQFTGSLTAASFVGAIVANSANGAPLSGQAYAWNSHALLGGVNVSATGSGDPSGPQSLPMELRNVQVVNGVVTAQLWANAGAGAGNFDATFALSTGVTGAFTAAQSLPAGWSVVTNPTAGSLILGGIGLTNLTGWSQLGAVSFTLPAGASQTQINLTAGDIGNTAATPFGLNWAAATTGSNGGFVLTAPTADTYSMTASLSAAGTASAINSADALAALKLAVGLNPNPTVDGVQGAVSPYTFIAADVTGDGRVNSADALTILKMAVGLAGAPAPSWVFLPDTQTFWNPATQSYSVSKTSVPVGFGITSGASGTLDLAAVLKGDVNASWAAPAGSSSLPLSYFANLSRSTGAPLATWGIGTLSVAQALAAFSGAGATPAVIADTAANIAANVDALQSKLGNIIGIVLTDPSNPTLTITSAQSSNDGGVLSAIVTPYNLSVPQFNSTWSWNGSAWNLLSGPGSANLQPQAGDTAIVAGGTVDTGFDPNLQGNFVEIGGVSGTVAVFNTAGDSGTTFTSPTFDAATTITSKVSGHVTAEATVLNLLGTTINAGTIVADGPTGSIFTVNIGTAAAGTVTLPGYAYNTGALIANAGNTLIVNVGTTSELFNTGRIVANGGTVQIRDAAGAIAGGEAPVRGLVLISAGGTVETAASYPASIGNNGARAYYAFTDQAAGNTLKIDNPGSFGDSILLFAAGDTIDLGTSLAVGTLVYNSQTSLLTLEDNAGTVLDTLSIGNWTGLQDGTFAVAGGSADGISLSIAANGDTLLTNTGTLTQSADVSGTWQATSSWAGGIVPAGSLSSVLGSNANAPFILSTGASPVTTGGLALVSRKATLQVTSNTTVTNQIQNFTGTVSVASGATLTAGAVQLTDSEAVLTVASGAVANLLGRINTNLAPVAGVWPTQLGGAPFALVVGAGTATVAGSVLAGPSASGRGGGISIGYDSAGQPATLMVNGGTVVTSRTTIGSDPTSSGTLIVDGAAASWTDMIDPLDTSYSRGLIQIGYSDVSLNTPAGTTPPPASAPAQLIIENGATMTEQQGASIGYTANSAGNVIVETGAFWNTAVNGVGGIAVGNNGNGMLSVLSGGSIALGATGTFLTNGTNTTFGGMGIGQQIGSTGTVVVSGAGSNISTMTGIAVGRAGQGLLDIVNGGTVTFTGGAISAGTTNAAGSSGTIVVGGTGAAAALNLGSTSGSSVIGSASKGTLVVADAGTVNVNGTGGLFIGSAAGSFGSVLVSGTSAAAVINLGTASLTDGFSGMGTITIGNLGTVALHGNGSVVVGQNSGASGTLTVQNGGLLSTVRGIAVGSLGAGSMTIAAGGTVTDGGFLTVAAGAASSGSVMVTGSGSNLSIQGASNLGNAVATTVTVQNGGSATFNGGVIIGPGSLLNDNSGTVAIAGTVSGAGTIEVQGGGTLLLGGATATNQTTILAGPDTASVNAGLGSPSLTFIGAPNAITLGSGTMAVSFTLQTASGIATIANFQYGIDQLNIDLAGAASNVLTTANTTVNGVQAISIYSSASPNSGIVLTGMTGGQTAGNLLSAHTTFNNGHAVIA